MTTSACLVEVGPSEPIVDPTEPAMTPPANCQFDSWDVTTNRRLTKRCSPYVIDGSIDVHEGATLTIDAGVEMRFSADQWLEVGDDGEGKLVAIGSEAEPIVFTSQTPATGAAGQWYGLFFRAGTLDGSTLRHAVIRFGGDTGHNVRGCLNARDVLDGVLTVEDVSFESCAQSGLFASGGAFAGLARLAFADSDAGLWLAAKNVGDVAGSFRYDNVPFNRIEGGAVTRSATWKKQALPWRVDRSIDVAGVAAPVLALEPGVRLQLGADEWIKIGGGEAGSLVAVGTATDAVVFESIAGGAGSWYGLMLRDGLMPGSRLDHVVVRDGGDTGHNVRGCVTLIGAKADRLSVTSSRFERCGQSGVASTGLDGFTFAAFDGNVFDDSDAGLWLHPTAVGSVGSTQTYDGVLFNRIAGGTIEDSATWVAQPVPWRVDRSIEVAGTLTPVLSLDAGVHLQLGVDEWIRIGGGDAGGLVANGTVEAPVVFESKAPQGAPGSWYGVVFGPATAAGSALDAAVVRHGGDTGHNVRGCVTMFAQTEGRVRITDSRFEGCGQSGIAAIGLGFTFASITGNTFVDSPAGLWLNAQSVGSVDGVQSYIDVPINRIEGAAVQLDATWVAQGVPYEVDRSIEVGSPAEPTLTLGAGLELRFGADEWLGVGKGHGGALIVAGSAAAPVVLGGAHDVPQPGDWYGIFLDRDTLSGTRIEHLHLSDAGDTGHNVRGGVTLRETATRVEIAGSRFTNNGQADVFVDCGSSPTLDANEYMSGGLGSPAQCP